MDHLFRFIGFSITLLLPLNLPFHTPIISFMQTCRAAYISPQGVETNFAFVLDTKAVLVGDVLQRAIQSLKSL